MSTNRFFTEFKRNVIGQYEECSGYSSLCRHTTFNPNDGLQCEADFEKVPFVTTTLFKKSHNLFKKLLRVDTRKILKWTTSSSTSGDPSIVGRTAEDMIHF